MGRGLRTVGPSGCILCVPGRLAALGGHRELGCSRAPHGRPATGGMALRPCMTSSSRRTAGTATGQGAMVPWSTWSPTLPPSDPWPMAIVGTKGGTCGFQGKVGGASWARRTGVRRGARSGVDTQLHSRHGTQTMHDGRWQEAHLLRPSRPGSGVEVHAAALTREGQACPPPGRLPGWPLVTA
jgi:hypothetical protein